MHYLKSGYVIQLIAFRWDKACIRSSPDPSLSCGSLLWFDYIEGGWESVQEVYTSLNPAVENNVGDLFLCLISVTSIGISTLQL